MNELTPLKNQVIVTDLEFGESVTKGGIILTDDDGIERGIHPRWAKVWKIGEGVSDIKLNDWILIAHGRWTRSTKMMIDGSEVKVNKVDYPNGILVVGKKPTDDVYNATTQTTYED